MIGCYLLNTIGAQPRGCAPQADAVEARSPAPRPAAARSARLLDTLTARERRVLLLRVRLAYSTDEAARALGVSPDQVRVIQHRALQRLRAAFGVQGR